MLNYIILCYFITSITFDVATFTSSLFYYNYIIGYITYNYINQVIHWNENQTGNKRKINSLHAPSTHQLFVSNWNRYLFQKCCSVFLTSCVFLTGLPRDFIKQLQALDTNVTYQAQDLVSALFKIKKYKQEHYEQLYNDLQGGYIIKNTVSILVAKMIGLMTRILVG